MAEVIKLKSNGQNWSEWRESIQKIAERQRLAKYLAGTPPIPFSDIRDSLVRRFIECTVPKTISRHFRHLGTARECIDYLTTRFDAPCQQYEDHLKSGWLTLEEITYRTQELNTRDLTQVGMQNGVGEMGETPRGRVDEEAAAATGPGTATTDHIWTDGISLATPASGPRDDQTVELDLVKPHPPPLVESTTPQPARTPPHANESHGNGQGDDNDNDKSRAHAKHVDEPPASQKVDEKTGDATNPNAERAGPTTPADSSSDPPDTPLDERAGHRAGEVVETAKATRDQGQPTETSASARSASRDHPDDDAKSTNPCRPSRDPADATGDDERRPDAPTEPPDMPEGTRGRGSRERVETRVTRVSESSRDVDEDPGEVGGEERRPGVPDEPFDEPNVEPRDLQSVQVEPGGDTEAERNRCATLESADAEIDGRVVGTCRDAQVEVESARTRVRGSTTAYARSTTAVDENGQRSEMDVEDAPEDPPESPPPMPMPDEPARLENGPPSVELEGEWKAVASCDVGLASDEADASTASGPVEDDGKWSKKLQKVSEREHERSKQTGRKDLPRKARDRLYDPSGEAVEPDDPHTYQEGLRGNTSDAVDRTDAPCRDTRLGGDGGDEVESRGTEVDLGRRNVGKGAEHDGIRPRGVRDERDVETNAPSREMPPGDPEGDQIESGDVESGRERQSVGDGDQAGGRRGWMDGATSGARRDSKRVETTPLAEGETGQHERRKRTTTDAPGPSEPPPDHPRSLTDYVDPPRRRGRLKTRPREVSTPGGPTRPRGRAKAVSGGSDTSYMMYMDRRWWRRVPAMRNARTRPLESIEDERAHLDSATT
jgi:hypothetical protein